MTADRPSEPGLAGTATETAGAEPPGSGLVGRVERRSVRLAVQAAFFVLFLGLAAIISGVLVALVGGSPTAVLDALLDGSLRSPGAWGRSLIEMVPLALVGLGVVVTFRAGSYNIGQEGQVAMGALGAAVVSLLVPGPAGLIMALSLIAAAAAGGFWAGIAAVAEARRKVDVLISTLLLTFVAPNVILFLVSRDYLLLDTTESNTRRASQSERIADEVRLPNVEIFGNKIHVGVLVAVAVTGLGFCWPAACGACGCARSASAPARPGVPACGRAWWAAGRWCSPAPPQGSPEGCSCPAPPSASRTRSPTTSAGMGCSSPSLPG